MSGPRRHEVGSPGVPGGRAGTTGRSLLCPVLVERDAEVRSVTAALDRLPHSGGVTVVVGEAGVGKTRLAREAVDVARGRGITVLSGRAVPTTSPVPYRPLTEAFAGAFRGAAPPGTPVLAGFGLHLGRLVPEWEATAPAGTDESPVLLAEAVVRLLRVAGERAGALLVLEDLHWSDGETLAVVEYLADALVDEPSACIVTARWEGAVVEGLARLRRNPAVALVPVEPLGAAGVAALVAGCLGTDDVPDEVVESVAAGSEGNPFLVEELLAGLVASGALRFEGGRWRAAGRLAPTVPFDFAESLRPRLAALGGSGRRVLRAAALLGRRFDWELLPALADVDGRAAVDALRTAVDEQLVEVDGEAFRFRHALTREAVLGELLPPERRELAQRALAAVERAHPGLPGPWCELSADLAEAAGDAGTAARLLVEAARRALAGGALRSAERAARRAVELAGDGAVTDDATEVLVSCLVQAGKPEEAAAAGERLAGRLGDPARRIDLLAVLARAAVAAGDTAAAEARVARAELLLGEVGTAPAHAARIDAVAAHVAIEQGRIDDAVSRARSAMRRAQETGQPAVECEALEVLGRSSRYGTDHGEALRWFRRAAEIAGRHGLAPWEVRAQHEIAILTAHTGGDIAPLLEARDFAASRGALVSVAVMDLTLAEIGLGDFDSQLCIDAGLRCVAASRRFGLATLPVAELWLAGGYALVDDGEAMEAAIGRALEPDPDDPRILGDLWGRVRATSAMVRDDRDGLRDALDRMMPYVRAAPITTSIYPNRVFWGLLHTMDDDDLGAAARRELAAATHIYAWPAFGVVAAVLDAVALGRQGRAGAAADRYAAAGARLARGLDRGFLHYFEVVVAEAAVRDGWGDPVPSLRRAEAFFAERGFDRIARRCRALLGAAGAPVPRRGRGQSAVPERLRAMGVTSRELDVLRLVAEGLTNRQIADRLHLSPKTVERHLGSLFDRTGHRSRGELGAFYLGGG
jgi:DNA-binding CsgD family transcriptional regulator/tetratricopeptide (TPR) repeat protein